LESSEVISKVGTKPAKNGFVNIWQINEVAVRRGLERTGFLENGVPIGVERGSSRTGEGVLSGVERGSYRATELVSRTHQENSSSNSPCGNDEDDEFQIETESKPTTSVPKIPVKIRVQAAPVEPEPAESGPKLCSECYLHEPLEGQELCLQCRLANVEVTVKDGLLP